MLGYTKIFKRLLDVSLSLTILLVLSPVFLFLIVTLLLANKGVGVFFTQERTGKDANLFKVVKFKTMTEERDADGKLLSDKERMTPVGRFIRFTSLDELPQLINVIKGDMSLIGPRPLLKKYIPLYSVEQFRRHEVRPGITGWAQVNGRNTISWRKKFELDVWYVDNISFLLDLKILVLTIKKVLGRKDIMPEDPSTFGPFTGNN